MAETKQRVRGHRCRRGIGFAAMVALAGTTLGGLLGAWASGVWTRLSSGTSAFLEAVSFADASHGWAVGDNGAVVTTTNGGATWTAQISGTTNKLAQGAHQITATYLGDAGNAPLTSNALSFTEQQCDHVHHDSALHAEPDRHRHLRRPKSQRG
jgi:hypothetical protein